jgi:hypothetical protein
MAATAKHLKQFEKIFLSIRENADAKLEQLNGEFLDHQEWLRKAVVDTKESKYGPSLLFLFSSLCSLHALCRSRLISDPARCTSHFCTLTGALARAAGILRSTPPQLLLMCCLL